MHEPLPRYPIQNTYGDGRLGTRFQKALIIIELETEMTSRIIKRVSILTDYDQAETTTATPEEVWRENVKKAMIGCALLGFASILIIGIWGKRKDLADKKSVE